MEVGTIMEKTLHLMAEIKEIKEIIQAVMKIILAAMEVIPAAVAEEELVVETPETREVFQEAMADHLMVVMEMVELAFQNHHHYLPANS